MNTTPTAVLVFTLIAMPLACIAQTPTTSRDQGLNFRNTLPQQFEPIIVAQTEADRHDERAGHWHAIAIDGHAPLAVDANGDAVSDRFDGFPNDPARWEGTDRNGIMSAMNAMDGDIDGGGITNTQEIAACTFPCKAASDGDGVPDPDKITAGTNSVDPPSL